MWVGASKGSLGKVVVGERATEAVLGFLRDTRVGCLVMRKPPEEDGCQFSALGFCTFVSTDCRP